MKITEIVSQKIHHKDMGKRGRAMKALGKIELQLSRIGIRNQFWGRPEIRELQHILSPDENITCAANGRYEGGFALLLTTDRRLLLIDKKIWFLSMEDIRYDMISEVDYCARLLDATISVITINKVLRFTTIRRKQLRALTNYIQERVMELRQQVNFQGEPSLQQNPVSPMQNAIQLPSQQSYVISNNDNNNQPPIARERLSRIGAYPTVSFTTQKRFTKQHY